MPEEISQEEIKETGVTPRFEIVTTEQIKKYWELRDLLNQSNKTEAAANHEWLIKQTKEVLPSVETIITLASMAFGQVWGMAAIRSAVASGIMHGIEIGAELVPKGKGKRTN